METIKPNEKYILTIIPQSPSRFNSANKKRLQLETIENSYESTRIDNSREQSRFESDFSIRNFLFSKLKVFELSNELKEVSEKIIYGDRDDDNDPYYHESLLSKAFDSNQTCY